MEMESTHGTSNELAAIGYAPAAPAAPRTTRRKSLRSEARRRRIMANIFFVCSSAVVVAVVGICYALLRE